MIANFLQRDLNMLQERVRTRISFLVVSNSSLYDLYTHTDCTYYTLNGYVRYVCF